jgi:hypothetical protein
MSRRTPAHRSPLSHHRLFQVRDISLATSHDIKRCLCNGKSHALLVYCFCDQYPKLPLTLNFCSHIKVLKASSSMHQPAVDIYLISYWLSYMSFYSIRDVLIEPVFSFRSFYWGQEHFVNIGTKLYYVGYVGAIYKYISNQKCAIPLSLSLSTSLLHSWQGKPQEREGGINGIVN